MADKFNCFIELCRNKKMEEAEEFYFANKDLKDLINEKIYNSEEDIAYIEKYVIGFENSKMKEIIENFINLCKENNLKEAKKYYIANEDLIDEINDGRYCKISENFIDDFFEKCIYDKQNKIVELIVDLKLVDVNSLFHYYILGECDGHLEFAKYISQNPIINKYVNIDDNILRGLCVQLNIKYEQTYDDSVLKLKNRNMIFEILKWILEEVKPDYDIIAIKTIKEGIKVYDYDNYPILKYLNEYIDKREKIILQEMINKCVMDNYIIFATATNK
jgi:hypothetical protein